MNERSLDQWGVITPSSEMEQPLILSDEHALYLYEQSHGRQVERNYDYLIAEKLAEEKEVEVQHQKYVENNYVRVGGN